ncbi:SMP-30/gluconolactonase/LRE family protein [Cribrihabitans neustonicus]|uniref:SMP-30/gluconolactonase/LRE family protein n=1 Tax=Cribrihabitans neustonicus TaxID=1429085 RepID=UPI003B5CB37B
MSAQVFDSRNCTLGEGPLWHPERQQLFWFDIQGKRLMSRDESGPLEWQFDEHVSAAGWVDHDTLLIASETALFRFGFAGGTREDVAALEADNPVTRSNDGRADPFGGFWIGTMGKNAEPGAGAIYRFYKGELVQLVPGITISNAICFSPDGRYVYYTDTPTRRILRQPLDGEGWPKGPAQLFADLSSEGLNPDGAVVDGEGCLWCAQWGAARVARYAPDGAFLSAIEYPASQMTCPAFGGPDLQTLFATSAAEGLDPAGDNDGRTFVVKTGTAGQAEHRVLLD